jgi:hypothetical protein
MRLEVEVMGETLAVGAENSRGVGLERRKEKKGERGDKEGKNRLVNASKKIGGGKK